ncbi:MAG: patatin [Rhizobiales bacterium 62-17]|nr:patatin-like phospholipase family protein [Hyphomicrobiales bacterium]OJX99595.1 MAG: patatin [Rhizobiales bacterium 62-17]
MAGKGKSNGTNAPKTVSLALQGGGSHGAFTWGVLDSILEDGRIEIEAITGTSAGAMNAVALAHGYLEGGRDGARATLEKFWSAVCDESGLNTAQRDIFDKMFASWTFDSSPVQAWMNFWSSFSSPYQFNPLNINPLRDHLTSIVDFDKLRASDGIKLFIGATNVHTGRIAIFDKKILTPDHLLASACLPTLFQAVEIDGVPYWDGGYMGNPALFPLFYNTQSPDIIIVQINPIERMVTPKTSRDIQNRLNEITFNGALLGELRAVYFVNRLFDEGVLGPPRYKRPFIHRIDGADETAIFSAASKMDARWSFLVQLRDIGRKVAKTWLDEHFDKIGKEGTLDLRLAYQ